MKNIIFSLCSVCTVFVPFKMENFQLLLTVNDLHNYKRVSYGHGVVNQKPSRDLWTTTNTSSTSSTQPQNGRQIRRLRNTGTCFLTSGNREKAYRPTSIGFFLNHAMGNCQDAYDNKLLRNPFPIC